MLYLRYYAVFKVKLAVTYGVSTGNPCVLYTIHKLGKTAFKTKLKESC